MVTYISQLADYVITVPGVLWGVFSIALTTISFVPYIIKTLKGINRPHIFSWIIWAILMAIGFSVQLVGGAGPGAWASAATALGCALVVLVAFKHGEKHITRIDWISFILALVIIPVWMITDSPPLAAFLVTAIDLLGYIPTFRKSWENPHQEVVFYHFVANIKHMFSLMAMQVFSFTTIFYPISLVVMNAALVVMLVWRRKMLESGGDVGGPGRT